MAQIAPIVLPDSVPANKTFTPVRIDSAGIATFAERSGGIPLGFPTVTLSVQEPTKNGAQNTKVKFKVTLPVLEQTSASTSSGIQPGPTLSYNLLFNGEFVLPNRSSLLQRKDLLAYTKNFLANATFLVAGVEQFEGPY